MELLAYRVQMYKCYIDSGWVDVSPLTVLVGKNESGKTALLKALHKFNPFVPEPYSISREWPRGHRDKQSEEQIVCLARFRLIPEEQERLQELTNQLGQLEVLEVAKDYGGRFEVLFPQDLFPDKIHPNDIDEILRGLPSLPAPVGDSFQKRAADCLEETGRLAREGRFSELSDLRTRHQTVLQQRLLVKAIRSAITKTLS